MSNISGRPFNSVVWTEQIASLPTKSYGFLKQFANSEPVWGNSPILHIVVSLIDVENTLNMFSKEKCNVVSLMPNTMFDELISFGLEEPFIFTMQEGLKELKQIDGATGKNLGIIIPQNNYNARNKARILCDKYSAVPWMHYKIDSDNLFVGPSLTQLSQKILVLYGVHPSLSLWLCNCCERNDIVDDESTLDEEIAKAHLYEKVDSVCINLGTAVFKSFKGQGKLFSLQSSDSETLRKTFSAFKIAPPISCHYSSKILINKTGLPLCIELEKYSRLANDNISNGRSLFRSIFTRGQCPWTHSCWQEDDLDEFFTDGKVFDHRSGAIAFDAYQWTISIVGNKMSLPHIWRKVVDYFEGLIEVPWQQDRPNYRRILAAPSKIILRGEEYYANLKNIAPWERLKSLLFATNALVEKLLSESLLSYSNLNEWKLCLAVFDQLRNAALQVAWFENQLPSLPSFKYLHSSEITAKVRSLNDNTSHLYYATLAGRTSKERLNNIKNTDCWPSLYKALMEIIKEIKKIANKNWRVDPSEPHIQVNKLIRRWREADHPGENTIVALQAWDKFKNGLPVAVGIGWGGIELPMVYRQVANLIDAKCSPSAVAAHYSAYRGNKEKPPPTVKALSPGEDNVDKILSNNDILLFDDNSLSGRTIQQVTEHLFKLYKARTNAVFLTRISGERRHAQMRMYEHGILNPELVGKFIFGFLGETPYSRAWSSEIGKYKNPIGVFSLARRRILELLFANSSADRFDREGF